MVIECLKGWTQKELKKKNAYNTQKGSHRGREQLCMGRLQGPCETFPFYWEYVAPITATKEAFGLRLGAASLA